MPSPLQSALRPASFRGVPFDVEDSGGTAGRRVQVHEYPQRDTPYAEDIGRATREIDIDAFVSGPDYTSRLFALLDALEKSGPGELVHPWLGTLKVALREPARYSLSRALGYAHVNLSFVEAGELAFPAAAASTQAQSRLAASALQSAAANRFSSRFNVAGFQDFVAADAPKNILNALGVVPLQSPWLAAVVYGDQLADLAARAIAQLGTPSALAATVLQGLGLAGAVSTVQRWGVIAQALLRTLGGAGLARPAAPAASTPSRLQAYTNAVAVTDLTRQALLVQAVGASSLIGTAADSGPALAFDDLIALRNLLTAALDAEAALAADDATWTALQDARARVWADLTTRARDSARLITWTPPAVLPALVIAYDRYEDPTRDAEIVTRNRIRRPGFVPRQPLQLLSR